MSTMSKLLFRGSILRIISFFAAAITGLLLMPFIIHSLGDKIYGLWLFVGSFLGFYGLLDLGLNSAMQRYASRAIGGKNFDEVNKIVNISLLIFCILGILALSVSFGAAFFVPLLIKNITDVDTFRRIMIILGINSAISFPMLVFSGILSTNIRYDLSVSIEILKLIIRTLLIVILLKLGYGIMALALITLIVNIIGYIIQYVLVKQFYKYVKFSIKFIDKSKVKTLFGYSFNTFIAQITDQLKFNIDNLVITAFLGLNYVTTYAIGVRLIRYFGRFIRAAIGIVMPVFSQDEAKGDYKAIREKFILMTKLSSYLSLSVGGTLIIFGKSFIERWVGIKYSESYIILMIFVVPAIIALMQNPSIQLLYGISKNRFYAIANSIEGISNLILSLILVRRFGIVGVALGTAIPALLIKVLAQPIYTCLAIKLSIKKFYLSVLLPAVIKSSIVFFVYWYLIKSFILPKYLNLIILISLGFIVFFVIIFFIGFNGQERKYFKTKLLSKKV